MLSTRRTRAALSIALAGAFVAAPAATIAAPGPGSSKKLTIVARVGPENERCPIAATLFKPRGVTRTNPAAAVLMTHGFGGDRKDLVQMAEDLRASGYVVLTYDQLGFGESGCKIRLDSPKWDGKAGSAMVTFLGGGLRAKDGTKVDYVERDRSAVGGKHLKYDTRLGMVGGSYGGGAQFATAMQDRRVDAIIPMVTWNDLRSAIQPQNARPDGVTLQTGVPGVAKMALLAQLFGSGGGTDTSPPKGKGGKPKPTGLERVCGAFPVDACREGISVFNNGILPPGLSGLLAEASVGNYLTRIRIPTFIIQGERDNMFPLNESIATYTSLKRLGVPVKLQWVSYGHGWGTPRPGEAGRRGKRGATLFLASGKPNLLGRGILEWLDHYVRGRGPKPKLDFTFNRPWRGATDYGRAASFPAVQGTTDLVLSGSGDLVSAGSAVEEGSAVLRIPDPGEPQSISENIVRGAARTFTPGDPDGGSVRFTSAPFDMPLDLVGSMSTTLTIDAAPEVAAGTPMLPGVALFAKVYDVAPDGSVSLPSDVISPFRLMPGQLGAPVTIQLPAIVHRFEPGHRIALVIAGSDNAFKPSGVPGEVTVTTGPGQPGVLRMPVWNGG